MSWPRQSVCIVATNLATAGIGIRYPGLTRCVDALRPDRSPASSAAPAGAAPWAHVQESGMETVSTIGHSNRSIEEFIALLKQNGIACLIDIRTVPKSRHNPQFGQDQLPRSLLDAGI